MKYLTCLAILLGVGTFAHATSPADFSGSWSGAIAVPDQPLNVTVHLKQAQSGWQGTIDIPSQLTIGRPLENISVEGSHIRFAIKGVPGAPTFDGTLKQDTIQGTFTQHGQSTSFKLSRQSAQAQPSAASGGQEEAGQPITLTTPSGKLYGTLDLPEGKGPFPVALIIAGSGPVDRNGNELPAVHTDAYKLLAEGLAKQGIASVRYDKRGVGESQAALTSEADLRFDTYVDDAVAWIKLLKQDSRFNAFVIIGHSEGSLIGILAAQQTNLDAFVSLEGAGFPAADVLRTQLKPQLSPELYDEVNQVLEQLEAGHTVPKLPAGIAKITSIAQDLFRPSVQPYLISWFKHDPAKEIAKLKIPILIVQGTTDLQVSMKDAKALAHAAPNAQLKVIEGMNHVLKEAPENRAKNIATYTNPSLPLAPGLLEAVSSFIKSASS
jgi:pimeloyl-ACP methyl ester carboxylesterase